MKRSKTETIILAMRILEREIQSVDGVANAAIAEAADRLAELDAKNARLKARLDELQARAEFDMECG